MQIDRSRAIRVLQMSNVPIGANFYALTVDQIMSLLAFADELKYRRPKNANGSRGRYFHEYMQRRARRKED